MDRGIFDSQIIERIDMFFDDDKRYNIPSFTEDEVKSFIKKYKEYLHPSKRYKSIEENAHEIFEDTKGHPIMVRFSVLRNGLKNHVIQMYTDYLLTTDNSPNTERIKSVIACSLYHISSIPLTEDELYNKLDLEIPSLQIINTMIKRTGNIWTTIHPRWDLELFNYLFSLNEVNLEKIKKVFSFIFNKIFEIQRRSFNQLLILNIVYNTIAVEQFIDIKIIQEMVDPVDIEKRLDDPYFKVVFFANILGVAFAKLKDYEYAIKYYDKAVEIDPQYVDAHYNKGNALYAIGKKEESILYYDKTIKAEPIYLRAYYNKGIVLLEFGKYEEAIDCFTTILKYDPQNMKGLLGKTNSLIQLNNKVEAKSLIDEIFSLYPNNETALEYKKMIE